MQGASIDPGASPLPQPGEVVAGKYRLTRVIGVGGMGRVMEAVHTRLEQRVAIKFLHPDLAANERAVARFEREGHAAARLLGPHVARTFDVGVTERGLPYMVMELLDGHDLQKELVRRPTIPVGELMHWMVQICEAIREAHAEGIVHRDLKPQNVFIARTFGGPTIKVLDFGISKILEAEGVSETTTQAALGTPRFMSPEQIKGARDVDARADVWALGVLAYFLLTRKYPFDGDSIGTLAVAIVMNEPKPIQERAPDLPAPLAEAIMAALVKDREARAPNVEWLLARIAPYAEAPEPAPPSTPSPARAEAVTVEGSSSPAASARGWLIGALVVSALGVLAIGAWAFADRRSSAERPAAPSSSALATGSAAALVRVESIGGPTPTAEPTASGSAAPAVAASAAHVASARAPAAASARPSAPASVRPPPTGRRPDSPTPSDNPLHL
ncbi:MAG: serine/threonine protein kinase [Myxococcales bacterium]|nr:serine/threonine protein kinase [Myxococcales bacterium]